MEYAMNRRARPQSSWGPVETVVTVVCGLAATAGAGYLSLISLLSIGLGWCGGDGGSPYAEPGSAQAAACDSTLVTWLSVVPTYAGPVVVLVATVVALHRRSALPLLVGAALGALLSFGPAAAWWLAFSS